MPISKSKKVEILSSLDSGMKDAETVVFVNFHKLTVAKANLLRRSLRASGIGYLVAKKTLATKVFSGKEISGTMPELSGELALCYGEDLIAPAREIFRFQKEFKEGLRILGGIFDGAYKSKEEMTVIAQIPTREVLYGQFLNLINSPLQGLVIGLSEIAKKKSA